jgi:hypothetical protein
MQSESWQVGGQHLRSKKFSFCFSGNPAVIFTANSTHGLFTMNNANTGMSVNMPAAQSARGRLSKLKN